MVFVTLICLVVAAYFIWEALKDKKNAEARASLPATHQTSSNKNADIPTTNYAKTDNAAHLETSDGAVKKEGSPGQSATAANSVETSATASGQTRATETDTRAGSSLSSAPESANDANVKLATGAAAAVAAVATASAINGRGAKSELRFLDGPIGRKDDLTRIDGVGPVIEEGLNNIGVFHYHQIANFTDTDVRNVDAELDFPGRIAREEWVEQARKLSTISLEQSSLEDTNDQLDSVVSIDRHAPLFVNSDSVLTDADYTGVWNTDVLIEIQERLKVLNTRISDAPRLRMTRDEYTAIKANDDGIFSRGRLLEILDRLRELD